MYIATLKIDSLRALAQLPDDFELVSVKPEHEAAATSGERWSAGTQVRLEGEDMPYTGMYKDNKPHGEGVYLWTNGSTYVG